MKNAIKSINTRPGQTEEWICELEERKLKKIIWLEENKEKRMKE